ncbi:stalk domain-containing protein [Paenibacillus thermotolerans]|uniref:stalk domain-containing protein n=1 Tax=Paenibacillus thermotolerans TaxID=3027807 RepID=UPI0023678248|nr:MULTISPECIES: stalk domain-containing protein [unclassified Paenibacillus]
MLKKSILLAVLLVMAAAPYNHVPKADAAETRYDGTGSAEQQKALDYVNMLRRHMGLNEVRLDPALVKAAVNHARYADAHFTIKSEGDLSAEEKGLEFYTQPTPGERAAAAGYSAGKQDIMETTYMKERAYEQFDMAYEIYELSLVHNRREVMLTPAVTAVGIARVGKATVIVGAAEAISNENAPVAASVFPYDGMKDVWPGYIEVSNGLKLIQGEGTTISVFSNRRDVSDIQASLTTRAGNRHIRIPLEIRELESGYGYVLTVQRQLRGDREYTAEVSFRSGGETLSKQWTFRTNDFQYPLNLDDMPLMTAPPLNNVNGRYEVPMRYLFELFGARVEWNKDTQTITAVKNDLTLQMTIGSHTAYINGQAVELDSPPRLNVYTTYVPLRFVSEAFGYDVHYDPVRGSVDIWTGMMERQ